MSNYKKTAKKNIYKRTSGKANTYRVQKMKNGTRFDKSFTSMTKAVTYLNKLK